MADFGSHFVVLDIAGPLSEVELGCSYVRRDDPVSGSERLSRSRGTRLAGAVRPRAVSHDDEAHGRARAES